MIYTQIPIFGLNMRTHLVYRVSGKPSVNFAFKEIALCVLCTHEYAREMVSTLVKRTGANAARTLVKTIESLRNCMTQKSITFFVVHEPFDSIGSVYLCVLLCSDIRK